MPERRSAHYGQRYLGRYKCDACPKLVRVYDDLPNHVLCRECAAKVAREEARMILARARGTDALDMNGQLRCPDAGLLHHSDHE
jgi:hypothetical protein